MKKLSKVYPFRKFDTSEAQKVSFNKEQIFESLGAYKQEIIRTNLDKMQNIAYNLRYGKY